MILSAISAFCLPTALNSTCSIRYFAMQFASSQSLLFTKVLKRFVSVCFATLETLFSSCSSRILSIIISIIIIMLLATMLSYATTKSPANISVIADGILVLLLVPIIVVAGLAIIFLLVFLYYLGRSYSAVNSMLGNLQIFTTKANRSVNKYDRMTNTQFQRLNRIVQIPVHAMGFLRRQFTKLF